MKRNWILIPSLIAAGNLPAVSLVSCGAKAIDLSLWNWARCRMESESMVLETETKYEFSINMDLWLGRGSASDYEYFELDILDGRSPTNRVLSIKIP